MPTIASALESLVLKRGEFWSIIIVLVLEVLRFLQREREEASTFPSSKSEIYQLIIYLHWIIIRKFVFWQYFFWEDERSHGQRPKGLHFLCIQIVDFAKVPDSVQQDESLLLTSRTGGELEMKSPY
ncbi:hypothetical protein CEXT_784431 [Caerostris extrusa]|uniref:Uncharacterized protein n=1 Tax=Caerostris extrusa TaxID=172846 RepID=A0AAV4R0J1_CAEEX|nr:hypothetical protein CEXT_784431 [Caerostris extrusa]